MGTPTYGYDPALHDLRLNHLHFRLHPSLKIRSLDVTGHSIDARLFLHIYPCGYLLVLVAVNIAGTLAHSYDALRVLLPETRPWHVGNKLRWTSMLGSGTLSEIVSYVVALAAQSINTTGVFPGTNSEPFSTMALVDDGGADDLGPRLDFRVRDQLDMSYTEPVFYRVGSLGRLTDDWVPGYRTWGRQLVNTDKGVVVLLSSNHKRRTALRAVWRVHAIHEFVELRHRIWADYVRFLTDRANRLRGGRLSLWEKVSAESPRMLSPHIPLVRDHILALDAHPNTLSAFYRRIYWHLIYQADLGWDAQRIDLGHALAEWEMEVDQWKHGANVLWSKLMRLGR